MKLSVIIPVYNTEEYIEKCLDSIANQAMKNLEIIIVNDGSTDNSENIIEQWIERNPNIGAKYFKKENGGLSDARNYGVTKATGKYISFVDSDDYLEKGLYKNLEKYMDQDIDLIKFKMATCKPNGEMIEKMDGSVFEKVTGEEAFEKLCTQDKFLQPACIYLYRREFFEKENFKYEVGTYHEDFGLTPWIMIHAKSVVSTNTFGYCYLQRENSITTNKNAEKEKQKAYDVLKHYDNAIENIENAEVSTKTKKLWKRYYTNSLILKAGTLEGQAQNEFIKEIKKRKVYKNIKAENLKQLIKKILIRINIKIYLNLQKSSNI